jgi:hypothetical protein
LFLKRCWNNWDRLTKLPTGHIQAIKPPALLEICGPLFMSFPTMSNLQYRLTEENGVMRLKFVHRAMGLIPQELVEGSRSADTGWNPMMERVRKGAESRKNSS